MMQDPSGARRQARQCMLGDAELREHMRTREWRLVSCCCRCSRDWRSLSASAFAAATAPLSCSARCLSCEHKDSASVSVSRQHGAPYDLPPLIICRAARLRYAARVVGPCTGLARGRTDEGLM